MGTGQAAADFGGAGLGVRKPDGRAPEDCEVGEGGWWRRGPSTGLPVRIRKGESTLLQRGGTGLAPCNKGPARASSGKVFQSLVYYRNELYVGEGVSTLGNDFGAPETQVPGGAAEPGPRALSRGASSSFAARGLISTPSAPSGSPHPPLLGRHLF